MKIFLLAVLFILAASSVAEATTYWVAKTGNDSNLCTDIDGEADPGTYRLTINGGIGCLAAGDTLIIKAGTYVESIGQDGSAGYPPSGSSWANATTLRRNSTDTVIVQRSGSSAPLILYSSSVGYIIFDGIIFDANLSGNAVFINNGTHHIRLVNCEAKNGRTTEGIGIGGSGVGNEVINCSVYDNGTNTLLDHGLYIGGGGNLFANNHIYNNAAGGIHFYNAGVNMGSGNIVRNNKIHDNSTGIISWDHTDALIYDNLIYDHTERGIITNDAPGHGIYNNTIVNSGLEGIYMSSATTVIKNNVLYNNNPDYFEDESATKDNNWCTAIGSGCEFEGNPNFMDLTGKDFHLTSNSSATLRDGGTDLSGIFTVDYDGSVQGQGSGWSIGAFEFVVDAAGRDPVTAPRGLVATPRAASTGRTGASSRGQTQ